VSFNATAKERPNDSPTLRVANVEFLDRTGKVVGTLSGQPLQASLKAETRPTQIRFTFNEPPDPKSVTTYAGVSGTAASSFSVIVERLVLVVSTHGGNTNTWTPLSGRITMSSAQPTVALYGAKKTGLSFAAGSYRCFLPSLPGHPAVTALDGTLLDGEPAALPSGDGVAGGTFAFTFVVA